MEALLDAIHGCTICKPHLALGPRPIVSAHPEAAVIIIGQAPGTKVHRTGIPWDDPSGKNLKKWLDCDDAIFYDPKKVALVPMGFCYPGKGTSGDLPPRPECAVQWHAPLLTQMPKVKLKILIGRYAQHYYLKGKVKRTLTETVLAYEEYRPDVFVLPHPSPRNRFWMKKNPWFLEQVVPELKSAFAKAIS